MDLLWIILTIGLAAAIVGVVLWTFVVAPFWVPLHSHSSHHAAPFSATVDDGVRAKSGPRA